MRSSDLLIAGIGWVLLSLGMGLLEGVRERRIGAAGLLVAGLALAAGGPAAAGWRADAGGDVGFLWANGGLLLLGLALAGGVAWAGSSRAGRMPARIATALGLALLGIVVVRDIFAAGYWQPVAVVVGLALAGAGTIALTRRVGSTALVRRIGRLLFGAPLRLQRSAASHGLVWLLPAGAVAVAAGPHVSVIFAGFVIVGWTAWLLGREPGGRPVPLVPVLTLVLIPAYWLLATIAGPLGLSTSRLSNVPLSPAAESLLAAMLLLAAWSVAGLWPWHRQLPGAITGAIGAVLLARLVLPLVPGGLDHWRPAIVPLLVLGIWHAAVHARWALAAVGGGLVGLTSGAAAGVSGAWWLLGTAVMLELIEWRMGTVPMAVRVAAFVATAWGGLAVLGGALQGEVVYSAVGTIGVACVVIGGAGGASAPSLRSG